MDRIFEAIEEWMRNLLTGMVSSNLTTMYTDVNEKTGEIAAQVGQTPQGWKCYLNGGRLETDRFLMEWAEEANSRGAGEILLTSMDADGAKTGYDIELTRAVSSAVRIPVIASGGAGNLDHMVDVLVEGKADAVLAASIFHFGEYTVPEAKAYFASRGIPVRPLAE